MLFARAYASGERLDRVARLYLAYKFFGALYFVYPVFYEFAVQAITPMQVGLFFSVIGICSFITDIPTAIIADKRSRKFCALIGMALLSVAPVVIFAGHSLAAYMAAALLYGVGGAFMSGALEALVYDHKHTTTAVYRRINALEITCGQAGILVSAACGGVLFSVHHGLPFIVQAVAGVVCVLLIAGMNEQYKKDHVISAVSHRRHFIESVRHLLATPYLRVLVLMGVTFSVMLGMCIQVANEAAMIEHGLRASTRGVVIAGAGAMTIVAVHLLLIRALTSDTARLMYLAGGAVVAYTLMSIGMLPLFFAGYLLWCCLNATSSFIRVMLQERIPGSHRTTVLSSYKSLAVLAGLAASTGTGLLIQWAHTPRAVYWLFALVSIALLLPCAFWLAGTIRREAAATKTTVSAS